MKKWMKTLENKKAKAFTLLEMKDSKILYIFHLITIASAVT
ncbi:competence protein [Streptococcus uberis]|nr:competence protein [Streptococcus uberis]